MSPSGKATGFGPVIRRFESCHPSQNQKRTPKESYFVSVLGKQDKNCKFRRRRGREKDLKPDTKSKICHLAK